MFKIMWTVVLLALMFVCMPFIWGAILLIGSALCSLWIFVPIGMIGWILWKSGNNFTKEQEEVQRGFALEKTHKEEKGWYYNKHPEEAPDLFFFNEANTKYAPKNWYADHPGDIPKGMDYLRYTG